MRAGATLVIDSIGEPSGLLARPRRRATRVPAAATRCAIASNCPQPLSPCRIASTASDPCECPTTATGAITSGSRPCFLSDSTAATWLRSTPGPLSAKSASSASDGTGSPASVARTHARGWKPSGRAISIESATGASMRSAAATAPASFCSRSASTTNSASVDNHGPPCPPKLIAYCSPAESRSIRDSAGLPVLRLPWCPWRNWSTVTGSPRGSGLG
ncbi:Uncharacterised protein [Mycobacteroides abscessus subsp. abscessus]|nr:Uncharacterised protein [Mycobacteroides abscessus subsp. abscessus]